MAFDFSPLYRSTIGFDGMTALFAHALDREEGGFPPYNIEKVGENTYRIAIALAGCRKTTLSSSLTPIGLASADAPNQ